MGLAREFDTTVTSAVTVTTTSETIVATSLAFSTRGPNEQVSIKGWVQMTLGTNTTGLTLRIRRGTTTSGTLVGVATPETVIAGNTGDFDINVVDTPGDVAGQQYVMTVQQTGASANGSVPQASLSISAGSN